MIAYTLELASNDLEKDPKPVLDELRKQGARIESVKSFTRPADGRMSALKVVHIRIAVGSLRNTIAHGIGFRFGWFVVILPPDEVAKHALYKNRT